MKYAIGHGRMLMQLLHTAALHCLSHKLDGRRLDLAFINSWDPCHDSSGLAVRAR